MILPPLFRPYSRVLTIGMVGTVIAVAACSDSTKPNCTPTSITVTGLPAQLPALEPVQLSAEVAPGSCTDADITWTASPGLTVTADGLVRGEALGGPFTVTAKSGAVEGTAQTTVVMSAAATDSRWALAWANNRNAASYDVEVGYSYSTGGTIRSTRSGPGRYAVRFPGLATQSKQRENIQLSAYGLDPRRCRVLSWANEGADLVVQVQCHDLTGVAQDANFTVLVVPAGSTQGRSGFVVTPELPTNNLPAATSYNSAQKGIRLTRSAVGQYSVTFDGLERTAALDDKETFQITAYGSGNAWCKVESWGETGVDLVAMVRCFTPAGVAADAQFSMLMLAKGRAGHRFGYVWASSETSLASYTPSSPYNFNSTGVLNTALLTASPGRYAVTWTGLNAGVGATAETNLVTAYGSNNTYCQVRNWSSLSTNVDCYAPNGSFINTMYNAMWVE